MTVYIYTPETLKKEIDMLVESKGYKFFILSSNLHGTAFAPSTKVPHYRIPVAIPDVFNSNKMNLGMAMRGFYMLGFDDPSILDSDAYKEYEKAVEIEMKERESK